MYRTLVVPLDGSPFSEHALPLALGIARRAGARLVLAQVRPREVFEGLASLYLRGNPHNGDLERACLNSGRHRLAAVARVPVETALLEGPVAGTLHEHALAAEADLVVLATHGHRPFSRLWLGSVADELIRRLPVPLLLVRPGEGPVDLRREPAFRRVLVPLDGSARAEKILEPALSLGALWEAEYVLIRAVALANGASQHQAHDYLEGVAERLRQRALRVRTLVLTHGHAAAAIQEAAAAEGADLIALATRGQGGLRRLLLGSVADKLIRATTMPLLVFHPLVPE
jgi:nucleotide-binding universal stress UspA family protein